jgi:hypothetical protein
MSKHSEGNTRLLAALQVEAVDLLSLVMTNTLGLSWPLRCLDTHPSSSKLLLGHENRPWAHRPVSSIILLAVE